MTAVTAAYRSLAATLALSAMLLRALLPMGWMPAPSAAGGPTLIICTMDGPQHRVPASNHDGQDDHGTVCPFAAAAHLAPPQAAPALALPVSVAFAAPIVAASLPRAAAFDAAHAPRGPPVPV